MITLYTCKRSSWEYVPCALENIQTMEEAKMYLSDLCGFGPDYIVKIEFGPVTVFRYKYDTKTLLGTAVESHSTLP